MSRTTIGMYMFYAVIICTKLIINEGAPLEHDLTSSLIMLQPVRDGEIFDSSHPSIPIWLFYDGTIVSVQED
jgi:hypothetical protein